MALQNCIGLLLLAWVCATNRAAASASLAFCEEGQGWQAVEVEEVSPLLVGSAIDTLWPLLYDTGESWEGCLLDELETAVEGCTQAVDGVAELEEFSGVDPGWQRALPADTVVWWLALNQTCPFHAGSWQFLEFLAAASNGSFIELLQVGPPLTILRSDSGFTQPSWLPEGGPSQPPPCGSARQNCCQDPQTYAASCTEPGLECMVHGPDAVCEAPRCAAPAPVEGRPGAFACPGGTMLVGTLVGPGG